MSQSRHYQTKTPSNTSILLFNKPYLVLSQFTGNEGQMTLSDWIPFPDIYAAGRLDADSEGLLVLTNNGRLQAAIANPKHKWTKTYWAQVEGIPTAAAIEQLQAGVDIGGYITQPCQVQCIDEPQTLWPRNPPIRFRAQIPTTWLQIQIQEGKNRQVRRMTAKVGLPTLRLIRCAIGPWHIDGLQPGAWRWASWPSHEIPLQHNAVRTPHRHRNPGGRKSRSTGPNSKNGY